MTHSVLAQCFRALLGVLFAAAGWVSAAQAELRLSQSFHSAALNGPFEYSVYLPPDYVEQPGRRYPVVYLLHGVGDNEKAWPKLGQVARIADALYAQKETSGLIVVMPDGKVSWYVNSAEAGGAGDYETAVMQDLVGHIDANYRTIAKRGSRAIAGHSMGGFGALRLAFRYPDQFVATAGLSPALWSRVTPETRLSERQEKIFRGSFGSPFDPERFLAREPRAYIETLKAADPKPVILLHAGDDDFFGIYKSTTALFARLRDEGLKAELRIGDGGHDWRYWRTVLPEVLKRFSTEFGAGTVAAALPTARSGPAEIVVPDDTLDVSRAMELLPDAGGTVYVRARKACYPVTRSVHMDRSNLSLIGEQGAALCLQDGVRQPVILVGSAARSVPESEHVRNIRIEGLTVDGNRLGQGRGGDPESARGRPHLKNNAISIHCAARVFLDRLVLRNARSGGLVISQRSREIFASRMVFADNHFDGIAVD
ncbi:MAG: alpha/beta hydrolase family protein, partial [Pseudomonadota bacterium]